MTEQTELIPPTDDDLNTHTLVAYFVDTARAAGAEPPRRVVGTIAKEVKDLLGQERVPRWSIRIGIDIVVERGLDPSMLSSAVFTAQRDPRWRENKADRELLKQYVADHGWPTGSRWVSGLAGGTFVQDTLGTDRPNYHVSWERPTREEIINALKERKEEST